MERDPVCGLTLRPGQEEADFRYEDRAYHFCSIDCQRLFREDPKQYIAEHQSAEAAP